MKKTQYKYTEFQAISKYQSKNILYYNTV